MLRNGSLLEFQPFLVLFLNEFVQFLFCGIDMYVDVILS